MSKKKKHRLTPPVSGNEVDPSATLDLMSDFDEEDDFEEDDEELEEEEETISVAPEAPVPVSEPVEEESTTTPTTTITDTLVGVLIGDTLATGEPTVADLKEANAQIDALIEERDTALAALALLKSKLVHISCLKISPDASAYNRRSNSLPLTPQEFTMLKTTFQF